MFFNKKKEVEKIYLKRPLSKSQWEYLYNKFENNPIAKDVLRDMKIEYLYVPDTRHHGLMIYGDHISMGPLRYTYADYGYSKLDYNTTREFAYYIGSHLNTECYGVCAIVNSTFSAGNDFYTDSGLHIGRPTETNDKVGSELYIQVELKKW